MRFELIFKAKGGKLYGLHYDKIATDPTDDGEIVTLLYQGLKWHVLDKRIEPFDDHSHLTTLTCYEVLETTHE